MTHLNVETFLFTRKSENHIGPDPDKIVIDTIECPNIITQTISTASGNLILNPAGNAVDFSGKDIINVGTIINSSLNYNLFGNYVTTNNTPTASLIIPTTLGANYLAKITLNYTIGIGATAVNEYSVKIKNISNVVSTSSKYDTKRVYDAPLTNTDSYTSVSGANVEIIIVGLPATTVSWFINANITKNDLLPITPSPTADIYTLSMTDVSTTNNTPTTIISIPTLTNYSYYAEVFLNIREPSTGETSVISYKLKIKNVSTIVTISNQFDMFKNADVSINNLYSTASVNATQVDIKGVGINAKTLYWSSFVRLMRIVI